jgi:hypothetical protein
MVILLTEVGRDVLEVSVHTKQRKIQAFLVLPYFAELKERVDSLSRERTSLYARALETCSIFHARVHVRPYLPD